MLVSAVGAEEHLEEDDRKSGVTLTTGLYGTYMCDEDNNTAI